MTLSDTQIEQIANAHHLRIKGLYLRNTVPKSRPRDGFYVFNLDHSHPGAVGTHWTAMYCGDICVYFDSYGCPPPIQVETFIHKRYKGYGFNNWQIQDLKSTSCGIFVLAFGIFMNNCNPKGIENRANIFVNQFVDNTKQNERILKSFHIVN